MAYTLFTWSDLQSQLSDRLGDTLFYSNQGAYPELEGYLKEAFRVWNCLAHFWRDRVTFQTAAGTPFYRLTDSALLTNPVGLMIPTITDLTLIAEQQYHLLESQPVIAGVVQADPVDPTLWRGTDQFNLLDLQRALIRRRNQFLYETAVTLRHSTVTGAISSEGRMDLPETTADVRRVSWVSNAGVHTNLWRQDEWGTTSQQPLWNISPTDPPYGFSLSLTPQIRVQILPPPSLGGSLDMLSVQNGATLPDDWQWAAKWGALADLLGHEGLARDPSRAAYCEQRWQQAIELAKLTPELLWGQINGVAIPLTSIQDLDSLSPGWEDTAGTPTLLAIERDIIDLLELQDIRHQIVGTLPYGLQKRVELARALALDPVLLLLDEPTAGMNAEETEDMVRFILYVKHVKRLTVVMIEHDMGVVMDLSHRVVVLNFGQKIADGAPDEVQGNAQVQAAYLGGHAA